MKEHVEKDGDNIHLLPLVSILIPTYNRPLYFEQSLRSVLNQTYSNIEIIIGDDSTNDETEKIIQKYLPYYQNITYIKNTPTLGQFENAIMLFDKANGEYINYLMDDDLFHLNKIEKMMKYYIDDKENDIKLITSHRQVIDTQGDPLPDVYSTMRLFETDTIMDGTQLGNIVIMNQRNYIGEPTTVLFRKKDLDEPYGTFDKRRYLCNVDVASWLHLLAKGKAVYIAETLSYFRLHPDQQLNESNKLIEGLEDFSHGIIAGEKYGFLSSKEDLDTAVTKFLEYARTIVSSPAVYSLEYYQTIMAKKLYMEKEKQYININSHLPKVSILIPSYNRPHYLEIALRSALNQTYENIEIIICDDSTNDEVKSMLEPYLKVYACITYMKNDVPLVAENFNKCIEYSKGEYINFLMDDDVFHHEKIERMMKYFLELKNISFVTSYRELIDENGELLPPSTLNPKMATETTLFDGKELGNYMLKNLKNVVGEPTTVLFNRKVFYGKFGYFKEKAYSAINDIATWIDMLKKGNAVYIEEPLSYFRQHRGQNQKQTNFILMTIEEWINLIDGARECGFLSSEKDYKESLSYCLENAGYILKETARQGELSYIKNENIKRELYKLVTRLFKDYFGYCPYCNQTFESFSPWPVDFDFPKYRFEMWNKDTGICPVCYSMDRERLYRIYIETETDLLRVNHKILHIAPEAKLREWLNQYTNLTYICGDLTPKDKYMEEVDVTKIAYENETFNVIICSHVLEHVPEDEKAMEELYRVLKPGGWGIVQVPIVMNIDSIIEDSSIVTPQMRKAVFGQEDHVRIYNQAGFIQRLKNAGFYVELYNIAEKHGIEQARKLGLSETDMLYIIRK
ncbi:glycosyltransferase [Bacillus gaemokensis]|uniref:Glycosyl transferase family 2 n=1 Tax=Bacillus gaemokensis TaxID=574375 RepID=A0A073KP34_9BACI|nr:glycosyltransferase [Bacillus gaemokensis]KEK24133.1 glycosyl transferase family 2 [Bacillus gaemokensis]KYG32724.1 glycosyl transferase family 2 [Bacillus gaemokensis]